MNCGIIAALFRTPVSMRNIFGAPPAYPSAGRTGLAFLLLSYLALSAMPFLPLLLGKPVDDPWMLLGLEAAAWMGAWSVLKRPAWFHWLLLPAYLALPTEVYLIVYYGQGISTHHLGIIAETSPKEALEFLGSTVWLLVAVMVAAIAWFIAGWVTAIRSRALAMPRPWRIVGVSYCALLGVLSLYGWEFGIAGSPSASPSAAQSAASPATSAASPAASASASPVAAADATADEEEEEGDSDASSDDSAAQKASAAIPAANRTGWKLAPLPHAVSWIHVLSDLDILGKTWPFGLTGRGFDFYQERKHLAELGRSSSTFKFNARQTGADTTPEVVVIVIGESARYDRWSLNGYERDTNPLLAKESNLVVLQDVVTAVSATRLSVPVIISRKPANQSLEDGFVEKSFLTAYKEAGFKTFWLSNQISFGKFDTPVSVFAKEADVIQFLNLGGYTNNSNFDQILLAPLHNTLADPAPKKLIVLHTLGSHWNYSQRHPKDFDKWQPSLFGVEQPAYTDLKIKPRMNNSYDNSVLYTDWFLSQVIEQLKASQQLSSMLYVADHGQTLYDGACRLAFHGHNTVHEFHVPAFVWYSSHYEDRYPDKVKQLQRHRKSRLATENMFHTLLDMADIRYPGDRLEWSFANRQFKQHKRLVDSYGWTNYDTAVIKGDCSEVVDKDRKVK